MMNKLSANLVGLEESVLAAADCSVMPGGGQDADCTIGNQTLGGGVPMEVVMEIKDQLLLLQNQLLENDPEKMRSLEKENAKLKQQLEELVSKVEEARKGQLTDVEKEELSEETETQVESLKRVETALRKKLEEQENEASLRMQGQYKELQETIQSLEHQLAETRQQLNDAGSASAAVPNAQINSSVDKGLHDISCDESVSFPKSPSRPLAVVNNSLAFADPGLNLNDISCDDGAASFLCPKSPASSLMVNNSLAMADPRLHETSCDASMLDTTSETFLCPQPPPSSLSSRSDAEATFTYSTAAPAKFRMSVSRGLVPREASANVPITNNTVVDSETPEKAPERVLVPLDESWQARMESKVAEVEQLEARLVELQAEVEKKVLAEEHLVEVRQELEAAKLKIE